MLLSKTNSTNAKQRTSKSFQYIHIFFLISVTDMVINWNWSKKIKISGMKQESLYSKSHNKAKQSDRSLDCCSNIKIGTVGTLIGSTAVADVLLKQVE